MNNSMNLDVLKIRRKGIEYCENHNCVTCPLTGKVCISSPYGLIHFPDRTEDFQKFMDNFDFMVFELTRNEDERTFT